MWNFRRGLELKMEIVFKVIVVMIFFRKNNEERRVILRLRGRRVLDRGCS